MLSYALIIVSVLAIPCMWRQPRVRPPKGLNTNQRKAAAMAQLLFFPLMIFNLVYTLIYLVASLAESLAVQSLSWLLPPIVICVALIIACLYWPINMCLGDTESYLNRCLGLLLLVLQAAYVVTSVMLTVITDNSLSLSAPIIATYYVPYSLYILAALSYLTAPKLWQPLLTYLCVHVRNIKVAFSYYLSAVVSLLLLGLFMRIIITVDMLLTLLVWLVDIFNPDLAQYLSQQTTAFLVIGTTVPIISYLLFLAGSYFSSRSYLLDNIVISNSSNELLQYYYAYFNFIGFFVGKQALLFTIFCWGLSGVVLAIYFVSAANMLGVACKTLALYIFPSLITMLVIGEIPKTIIGLWLYGRRYRPWFWFFKSPAPVAGHSLDVVDNVYLGHLEYFIFFYSIVLSMIETVFSKSNLVNFLTSVTPAKSTGSDIINLGYKNREQQLLPTST